MLSRMCRVLIALTLALWPCWARAQKSDDEASRRHFLAAQSYLNSASYADALHEFQEARRLKPYPAILYFIGLCQEKLERDVDALATLHQYLDEEPLTTRRVAVEDLMRALEQRIDRRRREAQAAAAAARVTAQPVAPPPRAPVGLLAGLGAGAVAVAVVATGLVASVGPALDDLKSQGCASPCGALDDLKARAYSSYTLFGVAGALVAVDVGLLIAHRHELGRARPTAFIAPVPMGLVAGGRF